jgi:hypothetical protein
VDLLNGTNIYNVYVPGRFNIMWASVGAEIKMIGKLRKNRSMYLRYGHSIKSLDENTLFPDAWEINVQIKDLTPNNFNTYIHHFIHGFQSNIEIIRTKVKKDNWITTTDAATREAMRKQLDELRKSRQGNAENSFVLFAAAAGSNTKNLMLENARMAAGISDGWLLDQIKPTEKELKLKAEADKLIEELNQKRTLLEESNDAIREQSAEKDRLERELKNSNLSAAEKAAKQAALNEVNALIEQHNVRKAQLEQELNTDNKEGIGAKAAAAAKEYAEEQYKRSRGTDTINYNTDKDAKTIIDRQVALMTGTVPKSTQMIMDAMTAIKNQHGYDIVDLREELEDGKIDDANIRQMWNDIAKAEVRVDSERTYWTMAS